jgi:hypothetical protein
MGSSTEDEDGGGTLCCSSELELEASIDGEAHALCFWFKLTMASDDAAAATSSALNLASVRDARTLRGDDGNFPRVLDTGPFVSKTCVTCLSLNSSDRPCHYCSRRHWRQAAVLLKPPRTLVAGDVIPIEVGIDLSYGVVCRVSD